MPVPSGTGLAVPNPRGLPAVKPYSYAPWAARLPGAVAFGGASAIGGSRE